ncbi:hypothetical protein KCU91_g3082, partial [Aureobasidium melanogenum]
MSSTTDEVSANKFITKYPTQLDEAPRFPDAGLADPSAPTPTDQDVVKTVFFVNMAPGSLTGDEKNKLAGIQQNVLDFSCWASHLASVSVQAKIDSKAIPKDDNTQQGSYRAKVMEWILNNKTTWLAKTNVQNSSQNIEIEKAQFHTEILKQALQGLTVPATALQSLEKIVTAIGDGITLSSKTEKTTQQYWIMLTYYIYHAESGVIQPIIRTIGFEATNATAEYMAGKNEITIVKFTCQFSGNQFDFNNKVYEGIKDSISAAQIEDGKKMLNDKTVVDIPL